MSLLKQLSNQARPHLGGCINKFVKEVQGLTYKPHSEQDVEKIMNKISLSYEYSKPTKQTAYLSELKKQMNNPLFVEELKQEVISYLDNRPSQERLDSYLQLCKQYNLKPKAVSNKEKLEQRINRIMESDGQSQD